MPLQIAMSRCLGAMVGVVAIVSLLASAAAQTLERRTYDMGTAPSTTPFHPVGVTLSALIKLKLLPTDGIDVNTRNTKGSIDNARLLREGDLDFAILTSLDAHNSAWGRGPFVGQKPDSDLRVVTNLWRSTYYLIVKSDLAPTGGLADFLDLSGRRVALGRSNSPTRAVTEALFDAFDVDVDEAFEAVDLDTEQSAEAFLNDKLDGFVLPVEASSDQALMAFLEKAGDKAVLLGMSDGDIETLNNAGPDVWSEFDIPARRYPGQAEARKTVSMAQVLCAHASVDDDVVYKITETIFDNLPFIQDMNAATEGIALENSLQKIALPVHHGAQLYYDEVGVTVPEPKPVVTSNLTAATFLTRFDTVEDARLRLSNAVTVLGGQPGETIDRLVGELAAGLRDSGIRVIGMTSPAPADNIADVLYAKGVDSALVPLDILDYAVEGDVYPDMRDKLVYATELFTQEVHLVTAGAVDDIVDLAEKPVNLGPRGSGSEFTASFLFDGLNVPIQPVHYEPRKALELLRSGDLAAAVFVAGKPMPLLKEIQAKDGLRLLAVPPLEGAAYRPATITAADYPAMIAEGKTVETFAVRTALMTYDWPQDSPRRAALSAFISAFKDQLPAMKAEGAGLHPKWQEIDPAADLEGWRRFSTAGGGAASSEASTGGVQGTDGQTAPRG